MKIYNMQSARGNKVPNQFEIDGFVFEHEGEKIEGIMFMSYQSHIAFKPFGGKVMLDAEKWDYSTTTGKYRNQFLRETKKETEKKIKNGEYLLVNLNR